MLATVTYGDKKVLNQGYDPFDTSEEVKIFNPGETNDGYMTDTTLFQDGQESNDLSPNN
jgi:hypothetical protein